MFRLPLTKRPKISREPFSTQTLGKASRLRGASVTEGICPYCAVGCGRFGFGQPIQVRWARIRLRAQE
jgi:formate dehydrogenase major subunit